MGIFDKISEYFGGMAGSLERELPPGRSEVVGNPAHTRLKMKFKDVLIVDDIETHAEAALRAFKDFYTQGFITVHIAHSPLQAREAFAAHDIKLVILDADLADDSGDGESLLREFLGGKPGLVVLANSSQARYNDRLIAAGAKAALGKDPARLAAWLRENG